MKTLATAVRASLAAASILVAAWNPVHAQKKRAPEFTRQGILVSNFSAPAADASGSDLRFGRSVGDAVRDRLDHLVNKRDAKVVSGRELRDRLLRSSYPPDIAFTLPELKIIGEYFRVDELVVGTARRANARVTIDASIVLWRDMRLRQPIERVSDADFNKAVAAMATRVNDARSQLVSQRRCENALREGDGARAIQAAREGIATYQRGALVRTCLVLALRATGAPFEEQLTEAQTVLAIDSAAPYMLEAAAIAYDSLRKRPEAADMWLRFVATDSTNLELVERVLWSMAESGNSRRAEPLAVRMSDRYPDNMRLMRQKWRIANDNRNWPLAVAAGEQLFAHDSAAATDSVFYLRFATAYRMNGQPFKAVELVSRGVSTFPKDPRLYALYTQFVKEEADSVLPRGMALYPSSAELLALNAKELRARGKVEEALNASKKAVELDPKLAQGHLVIAQSEIELGRADSALVTLHRALDAGEDRRAIAAMALSKGNAFLRAANGTKLRADFQLAARYLAFADTLESTLQTKFLLGAAAVSVAQTALTEAPTIALKEEGCRVSQIGAEIIPIARASLEAGREVAPDAVKEYLDYLDVISPYAEKQINAFCHPPASGPNDRPPHGSPVAGNANQ